MGEIQEECGVFGIYESDKEEAGYDIYKGLTALQHRGQEAAGIAVADTEGPRGNLSLKKGTGLVSEVFSRNDLAELKGNIGVGHVRYSTAGGSVPENAQPIAMNYIKGTLALVHNGNLTNAESLRTEQMYRGLAHYTTSDSEVLSYEIVVKRLQTGSVEEAVREAAKTIKGGYACIVMSPRKLVGIRDPLGIKPLMLGKKKGAWILASESAAIRAVGGTPVRDIRPGEIVTISREGVRSDETLCTESAAHCVFEYIYFARNDSVIDGIEVSAARYRAGEALARTSPVEADLVTGAPDSGLIAAEGYAAASGIPFALAFHKNSYIGRSFIKPTEEERMNAVHMKLSVLESVVRNKRIVLIDDSIVRGTTMRQLIRMMKEAGAAAVHVRISSPPFLHPCFYGTDVPDTSHLIAADHSPGDICRSIGADSLAYLRIEDLDGTVNDLPVCKACFDGNYPVES